MINVIGLRDELQWFSMKMERVLRENDHKSGYEDMTPLQLLRRLKQEVGELDRAIRSGNASSDHIIIKEACDVANFALFIAVIADRDAPCPRAHWQQEA